MRRLGWLALWGMIRSVPQSQPAMATFLLTDIEGSTQLLRSHREDYARILAEHHRILREQFAEYGGREIDNQGDAFFVAFGRARDAVLCAAACQRNLASYAWPDGAIVRVRMGIHTGEAQLEAERYVGLSVHRAARISGAGHGGQVLVSQSTAALLADDEDLPGVALRDLGEHRLKDLSRPARLYQIDVEGLQTKFPPLAVEPPSERNPRRRTAVIAGVALTASLTLAAALYLTRRSTPPPTVVPDSLVRIDPATLKPTQVVPVGPAPDLVVVSGGYVWITHYILRGGSGPPGLVNTGNRTLTRVDPSTGKVTVVGGGLAPCGITPDPSGDVWVANCFTPRSGQGSNVVRINAKTLTFEHIWPAPGGAQSFYRGLAYGDGSLWAGTEAGTVDAITQFSPTGAKKNISISSPPGTLAWSGASGDLWITNFDEGTLTRLHTATGTETIILPRAANPGSVIFEGDTVWVGDWTSPQVVRLAALGSGLSNSVRLPTHNPSAGVWKIAAGAGYIWATTPDDDTLWRIDPNTNHVTRIALPYAPVGVATDAHGVWVTLRGLAP